MQVEVVAVTNEDGVPDIDYAVGVRSQNVTARSPGDYKAVDETLDFPVDEFEAFLDQNGDTRYRQTVSFNVVIVDNFYDEDAETFLLKLSASTGYEESVFGVPEIEVTINDNDTAGVTVTPTALTIEEGNSDTYEVVLDTRPSRKRNGYDSRSSEHRGYRGARVADLHPRQLERSQDRYGNGRSGQTTRSMRPRRRLPIRSPPPSPSTTA